VIDSSWGFDGSWMVRFVDSCGDGGFTQRLRAARLLSVICLWFVLTPGMGEYGFESRKDRKDLPYTFAVGDSKRPRHQRSEARDIFWHCNFQLRDVNSQARFSSTFNVCLTAGN
jgi:hypothetical protein